MEKIEETKGFYEYRTTMRALSDGLSLITRNATMLFKSTGILLIILSLVGGWSAYACLQFTGAAGDLYSLTDVYIKLLPPLVVMIILSLFFESTVYALFSQYVEKGFVPQQTWKSAWMPALRKSRRVVLVYVWILFLVFVYGSLSYYLASLSRWTLLATVPVCIFLGFWFLNQITAFLVEPGSLWGAINRSLGITVKGFGSFFVAALLLAIIQLGLSVLCMSPALACELIFTKAQISIAEGDAGDLPGYFMNVYFVARTISCFLMWIVGAMQVCCWNMVYGAVKTRIQLKKAEENSKSKEC